TDLSKVRPRPSMELAGWPHRRDKAARAPKQIIVPQDALDGDPFRKMKPTATNTHSLQDSSVGGVPGGEGTVFDPKTEQHVGCILGIGICSYRNLDGSDSFRALPGDDVEISYPTCAKPPKVLSDRFTAVDFYECKMNEFDCNFAFVPIRKVQEMRGMIDPA